MTLTEFENQVVDKVYMGENKDGLQLMSIETKDGQIHNFFLTKQMEVANEAH